MAFNIKNLQKRLNYLKMIKPLIITPEMKLILLESAKMKQDQF